MEVRTFCLWSALSLICAPGNAAKMVVRVFWLLENKIYRFYVTT